MNALTNGQSAIQAGMVPGSLTRDGVQQMYQRYALLKQQGATETTNSEMAQLTNMLRLLHDQQKQRNQGQSGGSVTLQSFRSHAESQVNGRPLNSSTAAPARLAMEPFKPPIQHMPNPTTNAPAVKLTTAQPSSSFSNDQLATLRNQIMAFKLISKNVAIPVQIQSAMFSVTKRSADVFAIETKSSGSNVTPAAVRRETGPLPSGSSSDGAHLAQDTTTKHETFTSPFSLFQVSKDRNSKEKRNLIPSIMPQGIELGRIQEEMERIVYNRVRDRKHELEMLPIQWREDSLVSQGLELSASSKLKALIEYKRLCLLPRQRSIRSELLRNLQHADSLSVAIHRPLFRRAKKQSLRDARITEKLEKQQRENREKREKQKHVDYLTAVANHGRTILKVSKDHQQARQKLGRLMLQQHLNIEKEEQRRIERTAKQRLQALKANDEEAYLKLLDQAKDSRITHLLKQTDTFLESLAEAVRNQQRDANEKFGHNESFVDEDSDDDEDGPKIDYYQVAHRVTEEVKFQPSNLVGGKLKDYQLKGLQWMVSLYNNNLNGILADEMGLGKTIQTISLITFLVETKRQNGPFLIVVPLSTLTNWNLEFEKWAPSITKVVYKGPPLARKQQQQQIRFNNFQVLLTTYEYVIKDRPILSKIKWQYLIIDEGHRMKNTQSKLSSTLTQYYSCRYRLILTGTPLQNNLPELWALLNFALPTIFKSVTSFDEWFNTPFANTGGQDKMELTEEEALLIIKRLHKVLRPFLLRRLKKDVESELPDKHEMVIKCQLSALQLKLYAQLKKHGMLYVNDGTKGTKSIKGLNNLLMQLRKLCNHPFVFEQVEQAINPSKVNNDFLWRTSGKFELLDRLLPKYFATNHRVLMFFQMTQIMDIMEDFLRLRGFRYLRLDGSTKSDDRSILLKDFNAPDSPYFIFLLSTRAGGLGLNLQAADTVIIYDSDWNPHQDLQAQDRAHRIGQKNEVRILRLISKKSVEETILERAQYKLDIDRKVVQAGKFDNKSTNEERDEFLRNLLETNMDDQTEENEEMDDEELNISIARSDHEVELFKKIDEERERVATYGVGKRFPRLFSEAELPAVYLSDFQPTNEQSDLLVGRGARERTTVRYDDGLTEEQWLEAIDDDDDTIEDASKRKRERITKRKENKLKRLGVGPESPEADSPGPDDFSEVQQSSKKKRGRQSKGEKRKAQELEEPEVQISSKRKRTKQKIVSDIDEPSAQRELLKRVFSRIYDVVVNLEDSETEGRKHSELFMSAPNRKLYPDYYQYIKQISTFNQIRSRIDKDYYNGTEDFERDFRLMFDNARLYNEERSVVHEDANIMEREFDSLFADEKSNNGAIFSLDSPAHQNDSTAPISSVGTPIATPHIHLKLGKRDDGHHGLNDPLEALNNVD